MAKNALLYSKAPYFHKLTALAAFFAIAACSSDEVPKVVTYHHKNGTDCGNNCPNKPTPETGDNAAPHAALSLLAIKQASRYLDLALKGKKSQYYNHCLDLNSEKKSATKDSLLITMDPKKCKDPQDGTTWSGLEEIEITYTDENRGLEAQIIEIKKLVNLKSNRISQIKKHQSKEILVNDETLFTKQTDGSFKFSYRGSLNIKTELKLKAKTVKDDARPNAEQIATNEIELEAEGTAFLLADQWKISSLSLDLHRYGTRVIEINSSLDLIPVEADAFTVLSCGHPVTNFLATQEISRQGQAPKTYNPIVKINALGEISIANGSGKFPPKKCENGLSELDETLTRADTEIVRN